MNIFEGTVNSRDLGGLPLHDGGATAAGRLYRSDALHALTPNGLQQLAESPIQTIVDFRTEAERGAAPNRLPDTRDFDQLQLSVLEGAVMPGLDAQLTAILDQGSHSPASAAQQQAAREAIAQALQRLPDLPQVYSAMLDHGAASFAEVARRIATSDGAVLIHCTAGKDRTGVCAAVLLDAIGVQRQAIIADYAQTEDNLAGPWFEAMAAMLRNRGLEITPQVAELIGGSPAEAITAALEKLDNCGGSAVYLREGGLTDTELADLRHRLTEEADKLATNGAPSMSQAEVNR